MVDVGVQVVDTDGVDTKDLHQSSITLALLRVAEGVLARHGVVAGTASWLVSHTDNLELVARVGVDEFLALDFEGLHSGDGRAGHRGQSHESRFQLESG